jgi:type VI protein secretion system component Hcp
MILVHIDGVPGDCNIAGYEETARGGTKSKIKSAGLEDGDGSGWFVADSFTFGVQREMKEAGGKSGTEDMNIGMGELQECSIGKSMDLSSPKLAQFAISGNALGTALIDFVEIAGGGKTEGKPLCYLRFKLDRCYVKSWTVNGDGDDRPTEEVAFFYNKIAFQYLATKDGKVFESAGFMEWDNVRNELWQDHNINLIKHVT